VVCFTGDELNLSDPMTSVRMVDISQGIHNRKSRGMERSRQDAGIIIAEGGDASY
jgi:hypothetical protein